MLSLLTRFFLLLFISLSCPAFSASSTAHTKPVNPQADTSKSDVSITIDGVISALLCEDSEIRVDANNHNYRVFPTVSIAGHVIHHRTDISTFCNDHLEVNQRVRIHGHLSQIEGVQNAIANASVTPLH